MANPSLSEYLAQSQRGLYQSVFGPEYLQKQSYFTVDSATGVFNTTYGRKVWQALNNQTRFFNAIPRTVWGNTAGWRIRSDFPSIRGIKNTSSGINRKRSTNTSTSFLHKARAEYTLIQPSL